MSAMSSGMHRQSVPIEPAAPWVPPERIRLVAVDLDGTLLTESKRVSGRTVDGLRCLPNYDARVWIPSARPPRSVRHIYTELGLDTLTINYNGALVWDEPNRQVVHHQPMDCELVRRIIEMGRDMFDELSV